MQHSNYFLVNTVHVCEEWNCNKRLFLESISRSERSPKYKYKFINLGDHLILFFQQIFFFYMYMHARLPARWHCNEQSVLYPRYFHTFRWHQFLTLCRNSCKCAKSIICTSQSLTSVTFTIILSKCYKSKGVIIMVRWLLPIVVIMLYRK